MQRTHLTELLSLIGQNLHSIRNARKETLQAVANSIGISHPVISKVENGRNENLSLKLLIKLCNHYEVTLQQALSLDVDHILKLTSSSSESIAEQGTSHEYKEEIAYLRGLVEEHILKIKK